MKIHGNFVVRLETVRNRGVRIAEVRLYCNSVLVDFFSFFFLYLFLGIGQTQSIDNIFHFSRAMVTFVRPCPNPG